MQAIQGIRGDDILRYEAAKRFRQLLDSDHGISRKAAIQRVRDELWRRCRRIGCSRTRIYAWCKRWGISTR